MVFHLQGNIEKKNKIMLKIMYDYCKLRGDNLINHDSYNLLENEHCKKIKKILEIVENNIFNYEQ